MCGYAVDASNPSGGIKSSEDGMALLNSPELQALQPWAPLIAAGLAGFVATVFGLIQASISRQQAKTAANKLKLDLFERRWAVYQAASTAISSAIAGNLNSNEQYQYQTSIRGARWIFSKEIEKYLEVTLWHLFIDFELACHELQHCGDREDRSEKAAHRAGLHKQLVAQLRNIEKVFDPYMQVKSS